MTPLTDLESPNEPWWARFVSKEGLGVALAIVFAWFLIMTVTNSLSRIEAKGDSHYSESSFYFHQLCVLTAKQTGEPIELCEPKH